VRARTRRWVQRSLERSAAALLLQISGRRCSFYENTVSVKSTNTVNTMDVLERYTERMTIELRLLHSALALAEHKHFARAAQSLHVSQPTLSRSIQNIERRIGTQLFERGSEGVTPTDAGKIFLQQARELVARSADLNREMDLLRGLEKGELKIGAATYPSAMMVDSAVVRLVLAHPAIRLQIYNDNRERLVPLLRKRELDLAVVVLNELEVEPELEITRLNQHQGYLVVRRRHPLLALKEIPTVQSMLQFPLVSASRIPTTMLKQLLADKKAKTTDQSHAQSFPTIACESLAMMKRLAAETDAVAILPLNVVWPEIRTGALAVLPLIPPVMKVEFAIIRLAHRSLSPIGETFVRFVQEVDAELLQFEQKNAPKFLAPPKRARSAAKS
jgi:DNA-binding transcriptional LysR family regulator